MAIESASSFSWATVGAIAVTGTLWWALVSWLRTDFPKVHSELGYSGVVQLPRWIADWNLLQWLFAFRYFRVNNPGLWVLCCAAQLSWLSAIYLLFVEPIYFEFALTPNTR